MDITTIRPPSFDSFTTGSAEGVSHITSSYDTVMNISATIQNAIFDIIWRNVFGISLLISMAILIGILYVVIRIKQIRELEDIKYASKPILSNGRVLFHSVAGAKDGTTVQSERWLEIMLHVQSHEAANWRQAIIEADIMLDSAITGKGYFGDSLGEKMKQVSRGDINSIDDAWEAHKVRNKIAHDGSDYDLNQREARRVIGLYENVFKELEYI